MCFQFCPNIYCAYVIDFFKRCYFKTYKGKYRKILNAREILSDKWPPYDAFQKTFRISRPCSVVKLCLTMQPHGLPHTRLHCLLEFARTLVHWVGDAIQPSYPLQQVLNYTWNLKWDQELLPWIKMVITYPYGTRLWLSHSSKNRIMWRIRETGYGNREKW